MRIRVVRNAARVVRRAYVRHAQLVQTSRKEQHLHAWHTHCKDATQRGAIGVSLLRLPARVPG